MSAPDRGIQPDSEFANILAAAFRKGRGRVHRDVPMAGGRADLMVEALGKKYLVELKSASEGRPDRLVPLLAQAILQVRALVASLREPVIPVAIVAAPRVSGAVAEQIKQFAASYAPDVGVGVIDGEGRRSFAGYGLESFDASPSSRVKSPRSGPAGVPDLFSDLNQWMLKVLVGQRIPDSLLAVPRMPFRNASQLAEAAGVSVMSAFRLIRELRNEGFLDDSDSLSIVRADELLERWIAANRQASREIPARWILKQDIQQFYAAVVNWQKHASQKKSKRRPYRCCVGLFAAADVLGLGLVRGVPPQIYLERLDPEMLRALGLSLDVADRRADVILRIPARPEAVFRAAVMRDGLPVSDVLQVWLDVSTYPARGREQADHIRKRALAPLFGRKRK